jgi:hypothetical protein
VEVWLHSFSTSALDRTKWSGLSPGHFTPRKVFLLSITWSYYAHLGQPKDLLPPLGTERFCTCPAHSLLSTPPMLLILFMRNSLYQTPCTRRTVFVGHNSPLLCNWGLACLWAVHAHQPYTGVCDMFCLRFINVRPTFLHTN